MEEYNWRERTNYQCDLLKFLNTNEDEINLNNNKNLLVVYTVNNENAKPFLQILFHKNVITEKQFLPSFIYLEKEREFIDCVKDFLLGLIGRYTYKFIGALNRPELTFENIQLDGFIEENDNNYLFFNVKNLEQYVYFYTNSLFRQPLCLGLVDEILNIGKIDNTPICLEDLCFFKKNSKLLYLTNNTGEQVETPIVGYCCKDTKHLNFTYVFGLSGDKNGRIGDYYYFKNYKGAMEELNKNKEGGIIRFALFVGKMKVLMNDLECPEKNDISFQNIDDFINWGDHYDCVFYFEDKNPVWVLKDYNQEIPVSLV